MHYESWPLGHAKIDTTAIYAKVSTRTIQAVASPLDRIIALMEGHEQTGRHPAEPVRAGLEFPDIFRSASPTLSGCPCRAPEHFDNMLTAQALLDFDGQRLAAEHIDNRQRAELLPAAELVVHEVQAPGFVRTLNPAARLPVHDHLAAARLLGAQGQAFFAVQPINDVPPDLPAFALQHHVHPSIAITDPRRDDLMHPLPNRRAWIACTRLALRRAADASPDRPCTRCSRLTTRYRLQHLS